MHRRCPRGSGASAGLEGLDDSVEGRQPVALEKEEVVQQWNHHPLRLHCVERKHDRKFVSRIKIMSTYFAVRM
jgi:hypothetical protein